MGGVVIELRRPVESAAADQIADTLRELVVAFTEVEDDSLATPAVSEGGTTLTEADQIADFLEQLRRDVASWNAFQSDSCYIGEDGRVC